MWFYCTASLHCVFNVTKLAPLQKGSTFFVSAAKTVQSPTRDTFALIQSFVAMLTQHYANFQPLSRKHGVLGWLQIAGIVPISHFKGRTPTVDVIIEIVFKLLQDLLFSPYIN